MKTCWVGPEWSSTPHIQKFGFIHLLQHDSTSQRWHEAQCHLSKCGIQVQKLKYSYPFSPGYMLPQIKLQLKITSLVKIFLEHVGSAQQNLAGLKCSFISPISQVFCLFGSVVISPFWNHHTQPFALRYLDLPPRSAFSVMGITYNPLEKLPFH